MSAGAMIWKNTFTATAQRSSTEILRLPVSLSRLLALLAENGEEDYGTNREDDYGSIGPSQFAFFTAFSLVARAISILGEDFACSPSIDSGGGIRVTWRRGDRQVKLICPAERDMTTYIYQASASGSSIRDQGVTAAVVADWLSWLVNREPTAAG